MNDALKVVLQELLELHTLRNEIDRAILMANGSVESKVDVLDRIEALDVLARRCNKRIAALPDELSDEEARRA